MPNLNSGPNFPFLFALVSQVWNIHSSIFCSGITQSATYSLPACDCYPQACIYIYKGCVERQWKWETEWQMRITCFETITERARLWKLFRTSFNERTQLILKPEYPWLAKQDTRKSSASRSILHLVTQHDNKQFLDNNFFYSNTRLNLLHSWFSILANSFKNLSNRLLITEA